MRRLPIILILVLLVPACQSQEALPQGLPPIEVHFSPKGGCCEAVVKELDAAKATVLVQAYSFTSAPIAKALVDAHKRGVKVEVILDKSQRSEKYSSADFVIHAGIPTKIDAQHAIAHNKIMIVDEATVIRSPELAAKYTANWQSHAGHSEPYAGKEKGFSETVHEQTAPAATNDVSDGFVASRNSAVFHKAGCKSAAKISEKNVVRYNSRDEAIQAGKKPCAECQP